MKIPTVKVEKVLVDNVKCGEIVRENREAKGKSLRWLAQKLNLSPPYVSDLERGRRNWSVQRFTEVIKILDAN